MEEETANKQKKQRHAEWEEMHLEYQYPEIRDYSVSVNESRMPNRKKEHPENSNKRLLETETQ